MKRVDTMMARIMHGTVFVTSLMKSSLKTFAGSRTCRRHRICAVMTRSRLHWVHVDCPAIVCMGVICYVLIVMLLAYPVCIPCGIWLAISLP